MVLASDLNNGLEDSIADDLTITCQDNGTYDKNIDDYLCTRVCPHPINPDLELMEISHNMTTDPKPEIYETKTYWCKNDKKLVRKGAFKMAVPTKHLDELMSMCQISGWLNETIESYTCTQDCIAPINYTEVFDYDFQVGGDTAIGSTVKYVESIFNIASLFHNLYQIHIHMQISISLFSYKCWDERKKVVNIYEDSDLLDVLNVTCLYNGSWSSNPTNFGCNGKLFFYFCYSNS